MMTGMVKDQQHLEKQMEKHMGCMAGFFQIFDRHHALSTKRLVTPKRLPPPRDDAAPSPAQPSAQEQHPKASPLRDIRSPAPEPGTPSEVSSCKSPLPFPIFEFKEGTRSPWKFSKEAPRLSLDSRATTDAKGSLYPREIRTATNAADSGDENDKQRRSPSVIARLMGIENLPRPEAEATKVAELRRSASESRVNRDLYRFVDGNSFQSKPMQQVQANRINGGLADGKTDGIVVRNAFRDAKNGRGETVKASPHRGGGMVQRKIFYDSTDFFPEPKRTASIYEEIEKRLKMRGIDEPSKDLETLKHILDALQLKGLLHSKRPLHQRNFVYENTFNDSPVMPMKPPSRQPPNRFGRNGSESPPTTFRSRPGATPRRNLNVVGDSVPSASPRNQIGGRTASVSTNRNDAGVKSPIRRRPLTVDVQKKANDVAEQRRVSPVQSPKVGPRRSGLDQRSPRARKPTVEMYSTAEDESSIVSESSISTPSQTDTERSKGDEFKDGKNLLDRCDKLLLSIAEMTATTGDLQPQPSPVSVLDSSLYREESSPSPITMKRSIEFKDIETPELDDDDVWTATISTTDSSKFENDGHELVYISDILRATTHLPEDSDIFLLLEKQHYLKRNNTTSRLSILNRKLIFDAITELLSRTQHFQWKKLPSPEKPPLQQIWAEFKKMKERDSSEDLFESICGVLRKDLAGDGITGWGESPVEVSETVLDVERMVFKELVSDVIGDLVADCNRSQLPRRRLVF